MAAIVDELESQRYDRQIRVWGNEAQNLIKNSNVLVLGLRGLHSEVVKNVVLAGVNVVLCDGSLVDWADLGSGFCVCEADVGREYAAAALPYVQQLNTFARVSTESKAIEDIDAEYLSRFGVVLIGSAPESELIRIDNLCRSASPSVVLFASASIGHDAYFLADFGEKFVFHCDPPNNHVLKSLCFPSLQLALSTPWAKLGSRFYALPKIYLKSRMLQSYYTKLNVKFGTPLSSGHFEAFKAHSEQLLQANGLSLSTLAPHSSLSDSELVALLHTAHTSSVVVNSVLGSVLAQEVIKAVSRSGQPAFNFVCFSSEDFVAREFPIPVAVETVIESSGPLPSFDSSVVIDDSSQSTSSVNGTTSGNNSSSNTAKHDSTDNSAPIVMDIDLLDD